MTAGAAHGADEWSTWLFPNCAEAAQRARHLLRSRSSRIRPGGRQLRDLSDVSVKPSDFRALADLCHQDRDFPADFAGWQALMALATSDSHLRKLYPEPLLLDVREFAEWCVRLNIVPCLDALRAFVIIKRREAS